MVQRLIYDPQVSAAVQRHAEQEGLPTATVIHVMNHCGNMDYVLVTYLAADHSALAYATSYTVGEWAHVWLVNKVDPCVGAYFIRRQSDSDLYRQVVASYVRHATRSCVTQAMFPETGVNLTGKLGRPRLGLLKYIVDSADRQGRDVVFFCQLP